jgi:NAD(P)-dependent dehydrogenase (short-subunit alcohol dehydrogenase family)
MDRMQGRVAIVTGGGSGIGEALCRELARRGATVIVADIDVDRATGVASAIARDGGSADARQVDVCDAAAVQTLVAEAVASHGRLDYMFNNAGIVIGGDARDLSLEDWRRVLQVDLWGVLHGTMAAYPVMVAQGFGHIVNTASSAGLVPYPTNLPYTAAKHAVVGLSTGLRLEAADLGVRVSVVCPGYVRTNIYDSAEIVNVPPEAREAQKSQLPFKMMDANAAARAILRGVAHNQPIIVFPMHARVLWRLYRLSPTLLQPLGLRMVRGFREWRTEPSPAGSGRMLAGKGFTMKPPVLFETRSRRQQLLLATLPAFGLGFVVGIALDLSAIAYVVLLVVAVLGGVAAGMEHRRPGIAALRSLTSGASFGAALLVGHWLLGRDATVARALPNPEALEVLVTAVGSVPLALLGVALRRRMDPAPADTSATVDRQALHRR